MTSRVPQVAPRISALYPVKAGVHNIFTDGRSQLQVGCMKAEATANKPVGSKTEILVNILAAQDKSLFG